MSPQVRTRRDGQVRPTRHRALQPLVLLWLTVVWVALWRHLSPLTVVSGVLVAMAASLVFPLPPLRLDVRVRPLALLWLVGHFLLDVVVSSVQVARVVLRSRPPTNAVVEVNLKTPSDVVLTVVAEMSSLIPGSIILEARRSTHTVFVHVLDVADEAAADDARRSVLALEARVVRALGHHVAHLDPDLDPDLDPRPADDPAAREGER